MNRKVVLGSMIAVGLGIGLFSTVERMMRAPVRPGAVRTVVPVDPLEIVTASKPALPANIVRTSAPSSPAAAGISARPTTRVEPGPDPEAIPPGPEVDKMAVCASVRDRNPVGESARISIKAGKVTCWMKIRNATGEKVRAVWTINGKTSNGPWLPVVATPCRTWTSKKLDASSKGKARVEIQDQDGCVLAMKEFEVVK